eukprot:7213078-Alexandrium_andersonii.AAC.1
MDQAEPRGAFEAAQPPLRASMEALGRPAVGDGERGIGHEEGVRGECFQPGPRCHRCWGGPRRACRCRRGRLSADEGPDRRPGAAL